MKKVLIDCDPGVDDILAILMVLYNPLLEINSMTTVNGNVAVEQATKNILKILALFQKNIPIIQGASASLVNQPHYAAHVFEKDGLGGMANQLYTPLDPVQKNAIDHIISTVRAKKIDSIIALGPLTNVALAYKKDPVIMNSLKEIIVMGGAIHCDGNITQHAEFNFFCDPHAASYVLQTATNLTLIPLDVTMKTILTKQKLMEINHAGLYSFITKITATWFEFYKKLGIKGIPLHDPLALGYCLNKEFVSLDHKRMKILLSGEKMGMCTISSEDDLGHNVISYASDIGNDDFISFFIECLNTIDCTNLSLI